MDDFIGIVFVLLLWVALIPVAFICAAALFLYLLVVSACAVAELVYKNLPVRFKFKKPSQ